MAARRIGTAPSLRVAGSIPWRAAQNPPHFHLEPHLRRSGPLVGLRVVLVPVLPPNVCLTPSPVTGRIPSR